MKLLFTLFLMTVSSTVFASSDSLRSRCFVVDRCVHVTTSCTDNYTDDGAADDTAYFQARVNRRYACPTNSGIQYIWEQAEISSYEYPILFDARAEARKECQAGLDKLKKDNGVCQ